MPGEMYPDDLRRVMAGLSQSLIDFVETNVWLWKYRGISLEDALADAREAEQYRNTAAVCLWNDRTIQYMIDCWDLV